MKMYGRHTGSLAAVVVLSALSPTAAEREAATLDGGGGMAASANYALHGSLGGIAGTAMAAAPQSVARHGYMGQLTEIADVTLTGTPATVAEETATQLSGAAVHHDGILTRLAGADIAWDAPAWPLAAIDASGLATAAIVYRDTPGPFSGTYRGVPGAGKVLVLDVDPDNFGAYAGDGLPDDWQVEHFGTDNPDAHPDADPTRTGQSTGFRFVAGLCPTNPAERFVFEIHPVPGQPLQKNMVFAPVADGRNYTVLAQTNLPAGAWTELETASEPEIVGDQATITDSEAVEPVKFYGIRIRWP